MKRIVTECVILVGFGFIAIGCATKTTGDDTTLTDTAALSASNDHDADERRDGPPPGRRPPEEAFAACEGREVGSECTVELRDRKLQGTCREGRDGDGLVCMPRPPEPPEEAFTACKSSREGDTCTLTLGDMLVGGTCRKAPDRSELACAPKGVKPPPRETDDEDLEATLDRLEREIGG
jgi:hypothetical protein